MSSKFGSTVRKAFALALREALPGFGPFKDSAMPPQCSVYRCLPTPTFSFYIVLQLHRNRDAFTVEIGWSGTNRLPGTKMPTSLDKAVTESEMAVRLGRLWEASKDVWWELSPRLSVLTATFDDFMDRKPVEDVPAKAAELVRDAVGHLVSDAIPYFLRVARAHGLDCAGAFTALPVIAVTPQRSR
jgi:hypothetical protein